MFVTYWKVKVHCIVIVILIQIMANEIINQNESVNCEVIQEARSRQGVEVSAHDTQSPPPRVFWVFFLPSRINTFYIWIRFHYVRTRNGIMAFRLATIGFSRIKMLSPVGGESGCAHRFPMAILMGFFFCVNQATRQISRIQREKYNFVFAV